ncbi:hypothetical protein [Streptomyces sp. NPDC002550]
MKKRAYFSSLAAISSAVSWQLSTSMNSRGTPSFGAVSTMSAWAPPLPGAFHFPVAGSGTSVWIYAALHLASTALTLCLKTPARANNPRPPCKQDRVTSS